MAAYRHRPGRYRYPYRLRGRGGNGEKLAGAALGLFVAASTVTHAAVSHHRAAARTATAKTVATSAVPVASGSETAFWRATLADLGAPDDAANTGSLTAWYPHEYASWPPGAANDPLDSTLAMPGSWNYNTFDGDLHVKSYPTASEGAQATAATLEGGYPMIVAALRSGAGICGGGYADELDEWSGGAYKEVC